jgi:membrane-bound acyltransferase YfiQ involved in biofilm formation
MCCDHVSCRVVWGVCGWVVDCVHTYFILVAYYSYIHATVEAACVVLIIMLLLVCASVFTKKYIYIKKSVYLLLGIVW